MTTKRGRRQYFFNLIWKAVGTNGENIRAYLTIIAVLAILALLPLNAKSAVLLSESFDAAAIPTGWTTDVWRFDQSGIRPNLTGGSGNYAMTFLPGTMSYSAELLTPAIDMTNMSFVSLEFKTDVYYYEPDGGDAYSNVDVSVDGGPWLTVWSRAYVNYRGPHTEGIDISGIAAGHSNVVIGFHYFDNATASWQVDDVKISDCLDTDNDGYGDPGGALCAGGSATDCNDGNAAINPGATETCDGVDNDCDSSVDEAGNNYYRDTDVDGYGDPNNTTSACSPPSGYVTNNLDCNDVNVDIHPNAIEWPVAEAGNGHYYSAVLDDGISWADAAAAATAAGGYLATLTSAAENAFVYDMVRGHSALWRSGGSGPWLGGYQSEGQLPADGWNWVTGETWSYTSWSSGEPNDYDGVDENKLRFWYGPYWNDESEGGYVAGYIIEFNQKPSGGDDNCNGIDENCNGLADENYSDTTTICSHGAVCTPGTGTEGPIVEDIDTCTDNIDNDCDGALDSMDGGCVTTPSGDKYVFERLWPTLQQPWYFDSPGGIATDINGNVYITDATYQRIQKYTLDGVFLTQWGSQGSGDGQFIDMHGIAVDNSGNVYIADTGNHRIQKFDSNGVYLSQWGSSGSGDGQFNSPYGIAVDSSGNVYVADTYNNRIQKFDSNGVYLSQWGSWGSGDGQFWGPYGIAADGSGNIYVADPNNNRIQKFNSNGGFLTKWIGNWPYSIAVDSAGNVYASNEDGVSIEKFDKDGMPLTSWGVDGCLDGEFKSIRGLAVDSSGNVHVTDFGNHRLQKFDSNGGFLTKWGSWGCGHGQFKGPEGIAVDSSGFVYAADTNNFRIQKFNDNGVHDDTWVVGDGPGIEAGNYYRPYDIAEDKSGNLYVLKILYRYPDYPYDSNRSVIQKFNSNGVLLTQLPSVDLRFPHGIAVDNAGHVYVTDSMNNRIQKFDSNLQLVATMGSGLLNYPYGIAVNSSGFVYVTDFSNRIQKFTSNGVFVNAWGSGCLLPNGPGCVDPDGGGPLESGDGQFSYPDGVAVDNAGNVYVTDDNHRVQKFTPDGQFLSKFGRLGSGPGMFNKPSDLAIYNDKIYVTDAGNNRIQVIKQVTVSSNNKAIVVAGGGPYAGNKLWEATQTAANFAYWTLMYQGFPSDRIKYLSSDKVKNLDLDGDGNSDVDDYATNDNLRNALCGSACGGTDEGWASGADNLFVYLVDHGGSGTFRMSGTETLSVNDLDSWLDTVQSSITGKIVIIYDACESGSFLTTLAGTNRILVTSTDTGESSYFVNQGSVSFSSFFWTNVFNGSNAKDAFDSAKNALTSVISGQHPKLNDNPSGAANTTNIGNRIIIYGDLPTIGSVSAITPTQSSATLTANNVTDSDGIARVWAVILPPDYASGASNNSVSGLPSIDLMPVEGTPDQYAATYDKFNIAGTYKIAVYAKDRIGNTSLPKTTTADGNPFNITVNNPLRRKAIIVAAGTENDLPPNWDGIEKGALAAFNALTFQGYNKDNDIYFLSPASIPGISKLPVLNNLINLNYAITSWANNSSTQDVVLYMVGNGDSETFNIKGTEPQETLTATQLDTWLDTLQTTITGKVTVIYDASLSGGFITLLAPPANKERILISSTGSNGSACFLSDGDISFSRYFWIKILNGENVRDAFFHAQDAMSITCRQQVAQISDDGDGVTNERGDGVKAFNYTIGAGIRLAGADPLIGEVVDNQDISGTDLPVTIWAKKVTTTGNIQEVWAVITPPGSSAVLPDQPVTDLTKVPLVWNEANQRYQGTSSDFPEFGRYKVAIYARDNDGNISMVEEKTFTRIGLKDSYEEDDDFENANIIVINAGSAQQHNFYDGDADWVKFYGIDDVSYEFIATNVGANNDVVIELYGSDGSTLIPPSPWNDPGGRGVGESHSWMCCTGDQSGFFYVKVFNALGLSGEGTEYDLAVNDTIGPGEGQLTGRVTISGTTTGINNALVKTFSGSTLVRQTETNSVGIYSMSHPVGPYTISITKSTYTLIAYTPVGIGFEIASAIDVEDKSAQMAQCTDNDGDTFTTCNGDCNDGNPAINPNTWWYLDSDGDGYGTASAAMQQCPQPTGYVQNNTDCSDSDANIYPGGPEVRIVSPKTYYWITQLQTAYNAAGSGATIQSKVATYTGSFTAGQNKAVTIKGGYDCSFTTNSGTTIINGNMNINNGTVTIEGIKVQYVQ